MFSSVITLEEGSAQCILACNLAITASGTGGGGYKDEQMKRCLCLRKLSRIQMGHEHT